MAAPSFAEEKNPQPVAPQPAPTVPAPKLIDPASTPNDPKKVAAKPDAERDNPQGMPEYPPDEGIQLLLDECIEIAVMNNLNLQMSRLDDRESDYAVRVAWAQYFPTFNERILHSNATNSNGAVDIHSDIAQQTPWGTKLDFAFDEHRGDWSQFTHSVSSTLTQPLWKGAGTDANLTQLRSARINRLIARGNLELNTQSLIFQVRSDYAAVIQQLQQRELSRSSVKSAHKLLEFVEARSEAGIQTRLDVAEAKLQLHTRELELVAIERSLPAAYDQLKEAMDVDLEERILVAVNAVDFGDVPPETLPDIEKEEDVLETDDAAGIVYLVKREIQSNNTIGKIIGPKKVIFQAQHFNASKVLDEALNNRVDLLNNRRALAVQQLQTMLAKNGLGAQVDLVGSYGRTDTSKALRAVNTGPDINNWTVGVNATVPWGKISDRAAYETALLELQKSEINLKRVRTTVHADVRDIMRALNEAERTVLIEALRVEQAKLTVKATFVLYKNGQRDLFQVVSVKNDLVSAEADYITSTLNYIVDLARLEVVVGKPTGRVDLQGQTLGGEVDAHLPESLKTKPMPRSAPDADPSCEDHALNKSRAYRCDPKPEPDTRTILVPERKPDCKCEIIDSKP